MKHKISLDEVFEMDLEMSIASEVTPTDSKCLKLRLRDGILNYTVTSYLIDSPATPNTVAYNYLDTAIKNYNAI